MPGNPRKQKIPPLALILLLLSSVTTKSPRSVVIPRLIRQYRLARKMTMPSLARKLQVSPNYIYLLESGQKFPSLQFCLDFAKHIDINLNWIKSQWLKDYLWWAQVRIQTRIGVECLSTLYAE